MSSISVRSRVIGDPILSALTGASFPVLSSALTALLRGSNKVFRVSERCAYSNLNYGYASIYSFLIKQAVTSEGSNAVFLFYSIEIGGAYSRSKQCGVTFRK